MIGYSGLHCRGDSQRLMNPGEIVVHEVEGHGMGLVFYLLAERIGQARHPSHAHSHREILSLYKAR